MQEAGHNVALADLDIINPYFRTREITDDLEAKGIRVISSILANSVIPWIFHPFHPS